MPTFWMVKAFTLKNIIKQRLRNKAYGNQGVLTILVSNGMYPKINDPRVKQVI